MYKAIVFLPYIILPIILYGLFATQAFGFSYYTTVDKISVAAGCVAYCWLLMQIVLAARVRIIERVIPLDSLYRLHAVMGVISLAVVPLHATLKPEYEDAPFSWQHTLGIAAFVLLIATGVMAALFLGGTPLTQLGLVRRIRNRLSAWLRLRFTLVRKLHHLSVIAAIAMYIHIAIIGDLWSPLAFKLSCTILLLSALAFYVHHQYLRPWRNRRHPFIVDACTHKGGVTSIEFHATTKKMVAFDPGQFVYVTFLGEPRLRETHPFTLASAPGAESLRICAKAVGCFTQQLPSATPGAMIALDGPYGGFSYAQLSPEAPLLFVAGGIGVTPFLSMFANLAANDPARHVCLLWSVGHREEFVQLDALKGWCEGMPNATLALHCTQEPEWHGPHGRIDHDALQEALATLPGAPMPHAFVCGPEGMIRALSAQLAGLGLPKQHIHMEKFSV